MGNITPIWKDIVLHTDNASDEFTVSILGEPVYQGKAVQQPHRHGADIRINDILEGYLSPLPFPTRPERLGRAYPYLSFTGTILGGEQVTGITLANWTYDESEAGVLDTESDNGISRPLRNIADRRQLFLWTPGGFTYRESYFESEEGDVEMIPLDYGTAVVDVPTIEGEYFLIEQEKITIASTCARYVLYYQNARGGWDSFLFLGNCRVEQPLTRNTIDTGWTGSLSRTKEWSNTTKRRYILNTDALVDYPEMSEDFATNIARATNVFLEDLQETAAMAGKHRVIPVIITDTQANFKSFKGDGKKLPQFTITAEEAFTRNRGL